MVKILAIFEIWAYMDITINSQTGLNLSISGSNPTNNKAILFTNIKVQDR